MRVLTLLPSKSLFPPSPSVVLRFFFFVRLFLLFCLFPSASFISPPLSLSLFSFSFFFLSRFIALFFPPFLLSLRAFWPRAKFQRVSIMRQVEFIEGWWKISTLSCTCASPGPTPPLCIYILILTRHFNRSFSENTATTLYDPFRPGIHCSRWLREPRR